jgi:hypothetical protein
MLRIDRAAVGTIRIFSNSPPEIRKGSAAQRHGGDLRDAPRTVIPAFRADYTVLLARNT